MELDAFFPYRLAVLSEAISRSMAQVYAKRFDLSRDEWRVLAALAEGGAIKTSRVIAKTTLDKMQVSRAVVRLERDKLLARENDPDDGRGHLLRILPLGRRLYRKIVPMVQAREAYLLAGLNAGERQALDAAFAKLSERARQLDLQG
jgi:DNA-binding MarR family transcriptional regulator